MTIVLILIGLVLAFFVGVLVIGALLVYVSFWVLLVGFFLIGTAVAKETGSDLAGLAVGSFCIGIVLWLAFRKPKNANG